LADFVLVVVVHAVGEADHEVGDGRDVDAAEGADRAGLAHARGQVAGQEGRLAGVEEQALDVGGAGARVDDRELAVGIGLGRSLGGVRQQETHGDDQVLALRDELVQVLLVVGLLLALQEHTLDAQFLHRALDAGPGGLVEGFVVDAAHVGDLTNGKGGLGRFGRGLFNYRRSGRLLDHRRHRRRRGCALAAAGSHQQGDDHQGHQDNIETLLHGASPPENR
jgi:hypothetical protein